MGKVLSTPQAIESARRRAAVLSALADGPKTTEQIRVHMVSGYAEAYQAIKKLVNEGLVQGSNPKRSCDKKWRLRPNAQA